MAIQQVTKRTFLPVAALFVAALALAACGDGMPPDLCQVTPPADADAYRARLQSDREGREQYFRTSPSSPVPEAVRADWGGLEYFDVDPAMRFEGPLVRRTTGRTFQIVTTAGEMRPCREIGYFVLDVGAGPEELPVYELLDQPESQRDLFVPFTDATTGTETYPAGRYLEVEVVERGRYRLDFNLAYNPSCAYGGSFECPVAPEENRLKGAVRAGEKGWEHEAPGATP